MKKRRIVESLISLKEYIDTQLQALERVREMGIAGEDIRYRAIEKATTLASNAMDKRLEGMNEFRNQLKDQAALFLTRVEYEAKYQQLYEKIESLQRIVYMGVGLALGIEFILKFFVK